MPSGTVEVGHFKRLPCFVILLIESLNVNGESQCLNRDKQYLIKVVQTNGGAGLSLRGVAETTDSSVNPKSLIKSTQFSFIKK